MDAHGNGSGDSRETDLLKQLIRRRSVTPEDAGCQEMMAELLGKLGFECERMPFGDVTNLWARRGTEAPLLCFAGHTDVVPTGNLDDWESAPFEPDIRNGMLYGRGAADMKGSLAAMLTAMERFVAANPDHSGSIALLITSDEEGQATNGTRRVIDELIARGEHIDWCVVGEPSSRRELGDAIRIGRRGSLTGSLTVRGQQGHVAYPQLASNPIRSFAPVLAQLNDITWDEGNDSFPPTSFEVVNLASGLGVHNVIPGNLSAEFNFRFSTEWNHEQLRSKVGAVLDRHELDYELEWHLSGEPFLTGPGKLIDAVVQSIREVSEIETEQSTAGGTSDGRFISPAGADVVELGPVNESIHKVNECVSVADLPRLSRMYERIAAILLASQDA